jgi:hypothetical protein
MTAFIAAVERIYFRLGSPCKLDGYRPNYTDDCSLAGQGFKSEPKTAEAGYFRFVPFSIIAILPYKPAAD